MASDLGLFGANFLSSMLQAQQFKKLQDQRDQEVKLKTKLYELQLQKEGQAAQQQQDTLGAREQFFNKVLGQTTIHNDGLPDTQIQDLGAKPMSLSEALADPQTFMMALKGRIDPNALRGPMPTGSVQELLAISQNPQLMDAAIKLREAGRNTTTINTGDTLPKPPAGFYRPDPTKPGLSMEPGGPAAQDAAAAAKKAQDNATAVAQQSSSIAGDVDKALGMISPLTTGIASNIKIKGTPAYNLEKQLATVKANIGFDKLQQMRAQSPTGGALGQVAVQELEGLQASVASLDQGQSPEQLKANLIKVKNHYQAWQDAVKAAAEQTSQQAPAPSGKVIDFNSLGK